MVTQEDVEEALEGDGRSNGKRRKKGKVKTKHRIRG